jgi:glutamine synthetase
VPKASPGRSIEATRVEVRCPDPSSNTYLAFAVMLAAGLDGVEKGMTLGEPVEESLFEMSAARIAEHGIRELPGTLGEALDELEQDEVVREALGAHVYSHFVAAKREEWDEYRTQVSDWEIDRYLDAY